RMHTPKLGLGSQSSVISVDLGWVDRPAEEALHDRRGCADDVARDHLVPLQGRTAQLRDRRDEGGGNDPGGVDQRPVHVEDHGLEPRRGAHGCGGYGRNVGGVVHSYPHGNTYGDNAAQWRSEYESRETDMSSA